MLGVRFAGQRATRIQQRSQSHRTVLRNSLGEENMMVCLGFKHAWYFVFKSGFGADSALHSGHLSLDD